MTTVTNPAPPPSDPRAGLREVLAEVRRVVVGSGRTIERLTACILAGGHVLVEGVPGLGKTVTASALADAIGGTFSRIQFTADLLPSDVVGTRIWRARDETFVVEPGPIFAHFVLADEINRAPAKVQSAMLEVMAERQVTIGGETLRLPRPFTVLATQNPIEQEGVYLLPEAQRDRFLMRILVGYPSLDEERTILERNEGEALHARRVADPELINAAADAARLIPVDVAVVDYVLRLVAATRDPASQGITELVGLLESGVSPRAAIGMLRAARALSYMRGQREITPQEVYDVAYDVLNHRLDLSFEALADGASPDDVLNLLLQSVPAPLHGTGQNFGSARAPLPGAAWAAPIGLAVPARPLGAPVVTKG